jgi:NAD(P)-dependent dehydrogenase (short-subunit alcohol dehydrogenase family)
VPNILDRFSLRGKVAVVTGASSGLGVAFATGLASAGADIAICARRADRLRDTQRAVQESGRRCVAVEADVSRPEDCRRVAEQAMAELGRVDVLINNAGMGTAVPALREPPEDFKRVIDVNLNGTYFMAQACAAAMRQTGGGSIVNIGSILGSTSAGLPQAAYSSSKAAIIGLTRDLAQQWT